MNKRKFSKKKMVPESWDTHLNRHEWSSLFPLFYHHLDECQNRDVMCWIESHARKEGHVPLWYMSLRNRLKHTMHILSPKEFESVLHDMIVITVRIVEDIVTCKKIYGILSPNAYALLRAKLVAWVRKFEAKTWNPIPVSGSWWPSVGGNSSIGVGNSSSEMTSSRYNEWPAFSHVLKSVSLTPVDDLKNTHCAWTNFVHSIPLNTITFGDIPDSLLSTMETNADSAKLQRENVRRHLMETVFPKFSTWDEFWNVSLNDLIIF